MPETSAHGDWVSHLDHMIASVETVILYAVGLDQEGFLSDRPTYDATLHNLTVLGEAATRVPDAVREANPQIPWQFIAAARERLIHGGPGMDVDDLWSLVQGEVPALLPLLRDFRAESLPAAA